jgi:hypothetical protein
MKESTLALAALTLVLISERLCCSAEIVLGEIAAPDRVEDSTAVVSVRPITSLRYDRKEFGRLKTWLRGKFPNWSFDQDGNHPVAKGEFRILEYTPFSQKGFRGVDFSVLYDDRIKKKWSESKNRGQSIVGYSWIQLVFEKKPNAPLKVKVDNHPEYPHSPFYSNYTPGKLAGGLATPEDEFWGTSIWKNHDRKYPTQRLSNPTGQVFFKKAYKGDVVNPALAGDLIIHDEPRRDKSEESISMDFHLFLVTFEWNKLYGKRAGGRVWLQDGMHWGFHVKPKRK